VTTKTAIQINEVGLRDGLQSLNRPIPTDNKLLMVERLVALGFKSIEIASFVNPRLMPAMADSAELASRVPRVEGVRYRGFAPNLKGLEAAAKSGIHDIGVAIAASDSFNQKNIRATTEQALAVAGEVAAAAAEYGIGFNACVATVVYCPFEGYVAPEKVARLVDELQALGSQNIVLGETIGRARPEEIHQLLTTLKDSLPAENIVAHFHDTWGQGLANYRVCLEQGVTCFDTSLGGLGGCPFAPGAAGNVATEDLLHMLGSDTYDTGLDLPEVAAVAREFCQHNELPYTSRAGNACLLSGDSPGPGAEDERPG